MTTSKKEKQRGIAYSAEKTNSIDNPYLDKV